MRLLIAVGVFVIVCASRALAAEEGPTIQGQGALSCGAWTAEKTRFPNEYPPGLAWVNGWLTRSSYVRRADLLRDIDTAAVDQWVTRYCAAHPLEALYIAASQLEIELAARTAARTAP